MIIRYLSTNALHLWLSWKQGPLFGYLFNLENIDSIKAMQQKYIFRANPKYLAWKRKKNLLTLINNSCGTFFVLANEASGYMYKLTIRFLVTLLKQD